MVSRAQIDKRGIEYVVCVVNGVTRALYRPDAWFGARKGRVAFTEDIVRSGPVFDVYVGPYGKRVPFTENSQNPVLHWPRPPR